jgi:hypothetical protein
MAIEERVVGVGQNIDDGVAHADDVVCPAGKGLKRAHLSDPTLRA